MKNDLYYCMCAGYKWTRFIFHTITLDLLCLCVKLLGDGDVRFSNPPFCYTNVDMS